MSKKPIFILLLGIFCLPVLNAQTHEYSLEEDLLWASPDGFELTMDIYTPDTGKKVYPVLIIFHGGGWLINNKSIMNDMSAYVVKNSEYVVCNVNYRLLGDMDNTVSMNEIVEDVFGAVLWIKENISQYKGDPDKVAVTGDSAGGHLAAMVVNSGNKLQRTGFSKKPLGFNPSYLPKNKSLKKIVRSKMMEVQAAMLSYGAFDMLAVCEGDFEQSSNIFWQMGGVQARPIFGDSISVEENPEYYQAVSPIYNIPNDRKLPPQLLTVGSEDDLTTPESIAAYKEALEKHGHPVDFWINEGRPHAFLDSGSNEYLKINFEEDAIPALDVMIEFLNEVFY